MNLISLKIRNLKCVESKDISFEDNSITLITGENKKGKTTIFLAIQIAFSGQFKKHLITSEKLNTYIELEFEHNDKVYKIIRMFHIKKSSSAKLIIDNKQFSNSTSMINKYLQTNFSYFFSLGFIYYSKMNKLLTEYSIKKNDFLIEFFKLQHVITLSTKIKECISKQQKTTPSWFIQFDPTAVEKDIQTLSKELIAIQEKNKDIENKKNEITEEVYKIKPMINKKIISIDKKRILSNKLKCILNKKSEIKTMVKLKQRILDISKDIATDTITKCPLCYSELNTDFNKIKSKLYNEITAANSEINKYSEDEDKIDDILYDSIVSDIKPDTERYKFLLEKNNKIKEIQNKLNEKRFNHKYKISDLKQQFENYKKIKTDLDKKQIDKLNNCYYTLDTIITEFATKIKEEIVDKMNEFLLVVYNGEVNISIKDEQFYLNNNDSEVMFDEYSSSGSELEIVITSFVFALSIICGNTILLLDEVFNTVSPTTFQKINKLLNYIKKYFNQIIIISHKSSFIFDNMVEIK